MICMFLCIFVYGMLFIVKFYTVISLFCVLVVIVVHVFTSAFLLHRNISQISGH